MQIQFHQTNQYNHFNSRFAVNTCKANNNASVHSRRRMMESQKQAEETEAVKVTISAEAMELSRQAKAMERYDHAVKRLLQFTNPNAEQAAETNAANQDEEAEEIVQLTDGDLYEELLNQVKIWGDKSHALLHDYNHQETAEMAEQKAAALNEMQELEEMQKSETAKLQREAQKAAEQASMQQEEINKKSSELIMMIESFKDRDEDEEQSVEGEEDTEDTGEDSAKSTGSLMEGEPGVMAAKGEMRILDTVNRMDASSTQRLAASTDSIKAVETERKNIYRANEAENFTIEEKIEGMAHYVATLANNEEVTKSFMERIEEEEDPAAKKKLQALMKYFGEMPMKNGYRDLKLDREFALQERINARDLWIAHLGNRHLVMAEQQEKELQSLFDADDIMRAQGQDSITERTEDIAERLQDKLDERDHIDEDTTPDDEVREEEKQEELEKEELEKEKLEDETLETENDEAETIHLPDDRI